MAAHPLKVGDRIKLVRIPPQVLADRERFPETFELLEKAIGREYETRGVDRYGHVEVWLHEDGSEDTTGATHSIWVEAEFVLVV